MPTKLGAYDVYGTLGKGKFSRVRFAVNKTTELSYAIKIIDKIKLRESGLLDQVKSDIAIMKSLDSPFCLGIRDMFASTEKIFLVLDLMMGGSLHQKFKKRGMMSEERARFYFQQIVRGVDYCHNAGVVLGAVTLEGILVDSEGRIKISDFGCAVMEAETLPDASGNSLLFGSRSRCLVAAKPTPTHYLAPETINLNSGVSRATDVWCMGVVLFALVCGYLPFDVKPTISEMLQKISTVIHEPFPPSLHAPLLDLLKSILVVSADSRLTVPDLKAHPWMMWDNSSSVKCDDSDDDDDVKHDIAAGAAGVAVGAAGLNGNVSVSGINFDSSIATGTVPLKQPASLKPMSQEDNSFFCQNSLATNLNFFSVLCIPLSTFTGETTAGPGDTNTSPVRRSSKSSTISPQRGGMPNTTTTTTTTSTPHFSGDSKHQAHSGAAAPSTSTKVGPKSKSPYDLMSEPESDQSEV